MNLDKGDIGTTEEYNDRTGWMIILSAGVGYNWVRVARRSRTNQLSVHLCICVHTCIYTHVCMHVCVEQKKKQHYFYTILFILTKFKIKVSELRRKVILTVLLVM